MRVSVDSDDPGYVNFTGYGRTTITVDGVDVTKRCYTADEGLGVAYCFDLNDKGDIFMDPFTDDVARTEVHGLVKITRMPA